ARGAAADGCRQRSNGGHSLVRLLLAAAAHGRRLSEGPQKATAQAAAPGNRKRAPSGAGRGIRTRASRFACSAAKVRGKTMSGYLRLGVNIDHVATIRNARGGIHPDPVKAARLAAAAGADGITAH